MRGGARPGAGRPKGKKEPQTLEKERVLAALKQRIMKAADLILNGQLSLARGQQFLYRIDTVNEDGKKVKGRPVLVTNEQEISDYLDGKFGYGESLDDEEHYYFITTKEPNNYAVDSMLNRAFGKPSESVDITSKGERVPIIIPAEVAERHNIKIDASRKPKAGG